MAFARRTGKPNHREFPAAATLVRGGLVQYDEAGEIIVAVTAKGVLGIAENAATASTTVLVDILKPGDEVETSPVTGTMAASEIGNEADIASETAITLTESNGDCIITGWNGDTTVNAGTAYITFKNLAHGSPGAGLETT